jgi:hypothetical protein
LGKQQSNEETKAKLPAVLAQPASETAPAEASS